MTVRSWWRSSCLLLLRYRKGLSSLSEVNVFSASASSSAAAPKCTTFIGDSPKRYLGTCYSDFVRQYTSALSNCSRGKGLLEANGQQVVYMHQIGTWINLFFTLLCLKMIMIAFFVRGKMVLGAQHIHEHAARTMLSFQPVTAQGACATNQCSVRSFASKASKKETKNEGQTRKEVSTIEDPFDAPTYNIPEKPVTFTEGASYSIVILAGLGVAVAAGYAVFKELIFEPKEYKVFSKALKRIQDDSQVRVRIGSPITGYGQESRNRAARQRIANKVFTDEDGVEHVQIGFYIRGPHGAGKVAAEMFKDNADKQWKYTYLIVQITQPSHSQLILESYMPAPPVPA